jgi:hypothetical protein
VLLALEFFKVANENKSYNLVHCWTELKDRCKWELGYLLYKKNLKNGGGNDSVVIDLEEEGSTNGALPKLPRGHKTSMADLKRDASTLFFGETLKGLMAEKEDAVAKRDEKRRREKEATRNSFIDLTKRALDIEESNARAEAIEAELN